MRGLRDHLGAYDGRATTLLGEAEAAFLGNPAYLDMLLPLVAEQEGHVANGATWLLKAALERGEALDAKQVTELAGALPEVHDWAAQLHVCQSLGYLAIPAGSAQQVADWLTPLLTHDRPFLRAWALDGLAHLAAQHSGYLGAAEKALLATEHDAAASVKARARKVARRLEKLRL